VDQSTEPIPAFDEILERRTFARLMVVA